MSIHDPKWKYVPLKKMAPGYLARKFARIRAEQAEQKAATEAKVQPIIKRKSS